MQSFRLDESYSVILRLLTHDVTMKYSLYETVNGGQSFLTVILLILRTIFMHFSKLRYKHEGDSMKKVGVF